MANTVKLKRSAVASKVPTTSDLQLGELAVNTYDGKLYMKKDDGTPAIIEIGAGGGSGTVTSVAMTVPTGLSITGSPITTSGTLALSLASGYSIPTTASQTNWDSAYTQRLQWDGGSTNLVAATARTSLGATTLGSNIFTITNPSAITFPRFNADNTVSALDAATFRTAIGAGTGSGTVTSVAALTLGTTGTDLSSTVATGTTTPVITLNVPTASASNRGALSSTDWSTFNGKINLSSAITGYTVGTNTALAATDTLLAALGKVQGQINARGTGTVTSVATGTGLTGGTITTTGTISLANTTVTAGSYTSANITVDAQGRITAAANGSSGASITISTTAPSSPTAGQLWWDSTYGKLKIYYNDGNTSQWVDAYPAGVSNTTGYGLWENSQYIGASYSITSGNSATSAGPITIASGVAVTIPSGSRWVIL